MPGIEGRGATTAASLFEVVAKEAVSDETGLVPLPCVVIFDCVFFFLLFRVLLIMNNKKQHSIKKK
jgi:hypothetical protein